MATIIYRESLQMKNAEQDKKGEKNEVQRCEKIDGSCDGIGSAGRRMSNWTG